MGSSKLLALLNGRCGVFPIVILSGHNYHLPRPSGGRAMPRACRRAPSESPYLSLQLPSNCPIGSTTPGDRHAISRSRSESPPIADTATVFGWGDVVSGKSRFNVAVTRRLGGIGETAVRVNDPGYLTWPCLATSRADSGRGTYGGRCRPASRQV